MDHGKIASDRGFGPLAKKHGIISLLDEPMIVVVQYDD
jgi:hypothetical protein